MAKLGYSSVTLTDLTDTLPVLLVLESNLTKSVQTKIGNKYDPDYAQEGVIITPSLYLGQEDLQIEKHSYFVDPENTGKQRDNGYIQYEIGNEKYYYGSSTEKSPIYVDIEGKLHYKKNLEDNITIEAYIRNFYLPDHNTTVELVQATNPITIVLLEDSNNYYAVIECTGGREHFEDSNASDIVMIAKLYQGIDEVSSENLEYEWQALGGEIKENKNNQIFSVKRKDVFNREYYTCTITDNSTGLTYSVSKLIQDFTDTYDCNIEYDVMPIFTDEEKTITLTVETYYRSERLEGKQGFNLSYAWIAKSKTTGANEIVLEESTSSILQITNSTLPDSLKQQDFIVYCKVFQTTTTNELYQIAGDTLVVSYTSPFSVNIEGQTIFVPTSSQGKYQGNNDKKYTFKFQLLGEDGKPITYNSSSSIFPQDINTENPTISFSHKEPTIWEFIGTVTLNTDNWAKLENSMMYSFSYTYLGQKFTETITVVKQFKGQNGDQGFSGYTIDLSNEFHTFSGGEMRADSDQNTTCEVLAFYGDNSLYVQKIQVGENKVIIYPKDERNTNLILDQDYVFYSFGENYLFFNTEEKSTGNISILIRTNNNSKDEKDLFLKDIQPIPLYISVSENQNDPNDKWKTFYKQFSYTINYYGKSYSINPSVNNIIYKVDGNYHPSAFSVNATCQEENGAINSYSEGKIVYSFNNGTSWKLLPTTGTGNITGYSNLDNIQIRLYSRIANITSSNLTAEYLNTLSSYLLDMETIPVLTSMEGYKFGGENLIKWSKELPIETNKWQKSKWLSVSSDGDFSVMDFNITADTDNVAGDDEWYAFSTPKIPLTEDLRNKKLCLSFLFKCDDFSKFKSIVENGVTKNPNYPMFICSCSVDFPFDKRDRYGSLGTIRDTKEKSSMTFETFEQGEWCKVYKVFELSENLFTSTDRFIDANKNGLYDKGEEIAGYSFENCKYFYIQFYLKNQGTFQIKQPKLEVGNIPTNWSSSSYDISFKNVSGINLLSGNTVKYEIEETTLLFDDLKPNTYYVCSWENNSEVSNNFCFRIVNGTSSKVFSTNPENKEILLFNDYSTSSSLYFDFGYYDSNNQFHSYSDLITFYNFKLEEGKIATSYFLTDQQINILLENLENEIPTLQSQDGTITINTPSGKLQFADLASFNNYKKDLDAKVSIQNGKIETISGDLVEINGELTVLTSSIVIESDQAKGGPYIQIQTIASETSTTSLQKNYLKLTDQKMSFYSYNSETNQDTEVAYLSDQKLFIQKAEILEELAFGGAKNEGKLIFATDKYGVAVYWRD